MAERIKSYLNENKPFLLMVIFSIISSFCLFLKSDDYIWYYVMENSELESYKIPNGRYFSNFITYIMLRCDIVRFIFYIIILLALFIFVSKLIDFERVSKNISYILTFILFLSMPKNIYSEVINWFSGFTNYIFSFLLTSIYIFFCFKIAFSDYSPNKYAVFLTFILSVAGGLCVEHISMYNIFFSTAIIFIIKNKRKKIYSCNISYLIGAISSFIIMMSDKSYAFIFNGNDKQGERKFEFSFADMYFRFYRKIIPNYAKIFWILNLIIAVSVLVLYAKADTKKLKYGKICTYTCLMYAGYSFFTSCFNDTKILSQSMKIIAIEGAFLILYLVSLIYILVKIIVDKNKKIRCMIYLISTLVVTVPFFVVSPMTARCLYANYMFWGLLAGELFFTAFKDFTFFKTNIFSNALFIISAIMCVFISGFNITNKYFNVLRYDYIKEQVESNSKVIYMVQLPYDEYAYDDLLNFESKNNDVDKIPIFKYYGIDDFEFDNYKYVSIAPADYLTMKDS